MCFGSRDKFAAGTCDGDSGSPIVFFGSLVEDSCLLGISTFTSHFCDDPLTPSVFARVEYFAQWLTDSMSQLSHTCKLRACTALR